MRDLNDEAMKEFTFEHPAVVFEYDEHHGGDDVGLWATGPMSYLFHKSHEQSYVAHVVGENICNLFKGGETLSPPRCSSYSKATAGCSNVHSSISFLVIPISHAPGSMRDLNVEAMKEVTFVHPAVVLSMTNTLVGTMSSSGPPAQANVIPFPQEP